MQLLGASQMVSGQLEWEDRTRLCPNHRRPRAQVSDLSNLAPSVKLFDHALLIYMYLRVYKFYICAMVTI